MSPLRREWEMGSWRWGHRRTDTSVLSGIPAPGRFAWDLPETEILKMLC